MSDNPAINTADLAGSTPDLDAILAKWRWLVPADVPVFIKYEELEDGKLAQVCVDVRNNRLLIKIAPPETKNENWGFEFERDIESDVVHELLHWRFELFTPEPGPVYELWEAAVERTAQDLIRLDRGNQ